jgi:Tol biopolymer transport system component
MSSRRARLLILTLGVVATLALLGVASTQASFPGPNGRIAFANFNDGQIYAVNPDGGGLRQLTHTGQDHIADFPSWSPGGRRILFSRYRADKPFGENDGRIWVMNADGTGKAPVGQDQDGFRDYNPKYTPDASFIVFTRCKPNDGLCAIWRMRSDGSHRQALTPYIEPPNNEAVDFGPSVSPDGARIAFSRNDADGYLARIFVMALDGTNPHPVSPPRLEGFAPDWSPNGKRITFSSNSARPGSSVFTMRADGTDVKRLTPDRFPHNDFDSVYSPSGDRIAFASDRNYPGLCCADLFTIGARGGADHLVDVGLHSPGIYNLSWGTSPRIP